MLNKYWRIRESKVSKITHQISLPDFY